MPDRIATARLTLRPLRQADARPLHAVFSDAQAMRYFGEVHASVADTEAWVVRALRQPPDTCREHVLVQDGAVIGRAAIWSRPELGYLLRRDRWGQGLMGEALTALIPHFFATMDLRGGIRADVEPRNAASLGLLARLGFTETGRAPNTIRIAGEWADSVYLHLPAPAG